MALPDMGARRAAFRLKTATVQRPAGRLLESLQDNERLPMDELRTLQRARAAEMARFAMARTTFYAERGAAAGVGVADLADGGDLSAAAFAALPVTEKDDVRDRPADLRTDEASARTARTARTGGSTGQPLHTLVDRRVPVIALSWRMLRWWGVHPSDDALHVARWSAGRAGTLWQRARWWPTQQFQVDAGHLDQRVADDVAQWWRRNRPPLVEGYIEAVAELAEFLARLADPLPPPRAVGVTAAPLTPSVRSRLQELFGAPVYDQYRSAEVPWLAGECREQDGLHVFADLRLLEVVDEAGVPLPDGQEGDVVVTDLTNRVLPLIRYRLGDRATLRPRTRPCPCGVTLPLLEPPGGRSIDVVRLPDGAVVAGGLTMIFARRPDAVRQFQIHQSVDHSITLRVVLSGAGDAEAAVATVADDLRARTRGLVPVRIEPVDTIPHERGKTRYIISDVPRP